MFSVSPPDPPKGENMKSKAAIIAMAVVMMAMVGCGLFYADDVEAQDVSTADAFIDSMQDASTTEIKLTQDITLSEPITVPEGAEIRLDLAGCSITLSQAVNDEGKTVKGKITVDEGAVLTIEDSSSDGTGSIGGVTSSGVSVEGTLNVAGGSIDSEGTYAVNTSSDAVLNMSGGSIGEETERAIFFRGTANITAGSVGTVYFYSEDAVLVLGEEGAGGPIVGKLQNKSGTVHFYSGVVKAISDFTFNPDSSFTADAKFSTSDITSNVPERYDVEGPDSENMYRLVPLTEAEANAALERNGEKYYFRDIEAASEYMINGDSMRLLSDYNGGLEFRIYVGTIDLNGYDVDNTGGDYAIEIHPMSGSEYAEGVVEIVNNGSEKSVISADVPVYLDSGYSVNRLYVDFGPDLEFVSSGSTSIELGDSAAIQYEDSMLSMFGNGVFKATRGGVEYVYGSAASALVEADDHVAELMGDYSGSITIGTSGTYVLDLCEHSVTYEDTYVEGAVQAGILINDKNISLTVKNGSVSSNLYGAVAAVAHNVGVGGHYDNNTLVLDKVKLTAGTDFAVYSNGTCEDINIQILNGSDIECSDTTGIGVYFPSTGKLTISDSKVTGGSGVEIRKGSLEISGDTLIEAKGTYREPVENGSGATSMGVAVAISPYDASEGTERVMEVSITGGSLTGPVAFEQANPNNAQNVKYDFSISGGEFSSDAGHDAIVVDDSESDKFTNTQFVSGGTFESGGSIDESITKFVNPAYTYDEETGEFEENTEAIVAYIGDRPYASLVQAASEAADGDKIVLVKPVTIDGARPTFNAGVTLDLGGNTITIQSTGTSNVGMWFASGESEVTNGHIVDNRQAEEQKSVFTIYAVGSGTSVELTDVDIRITNSVAPGSYSVAAYVAGYASMTLGSGFGVLAVGGTQEGSGGSIGAMVVGANATGEEPTTLTVLDGADIHVNGFAVSGNGTDGYTPTVIDIRGGTLTSDVSAAVYHPQEGSMSVSGGTLSGSTGIEIRSGTLSVSGGAIVGNGSQFDCVPNESGSTTTGAGIAVVEHTTEKPIDVAISGNPEISGQYALFQSNPQENPVSSVKGISVVITGGTFDGDREAVLMEDFAELKEGSGISGGTYNTPVTDYLDDGITEEEEGGDIVVLQPVRFDAGRIEVYTSSFTLPIVVPPGIKYNVTFSDDGTTISNGIVTTDGSESLVTATLVAEYNGHSYTDSMNIYVYSYDVTDDDTIMIAWTEAAQDEMDMRDDEVVDVPDGCHTTSLDISRAPGGSGPVRLNMTDIIEDRGLFVVEDPVFGYDPGQYDVVVAHFGDTVDYPEVEIENGNVYVTVTDFSTYGFYIYLVEEEQDGPIIIPGWDDDDEYVPPVVPVQPSDSGEGDTTTIVACAAAAVVAALMAVFLIIERRRS